MSKKGLFLQRFQVCNNYNFIMDTKQKASEILTGYGIRPSVQRVEIYDYLQKYRSHPTVDEIYSFLSPQMPTLSRTTIYNTLTLFASKGAVLVLNIEEKNQRFDAGIAPHAHFQCQKCGKIYDFPQPLVQLDEQIITDFEILETQINYKGICKTCKNKH